MKVKQFIKILQEQADPESEIRLVIRNPRVCETNGEIRYIESAKDITSIVGIETTWGSKKISEE